MGSANNPEGRTNGEGEGEGEGASRIVSIFGGRSDGGWRVQIVAARWRGVDQGAFVICMRGLSTGANAVEIRFAGCPVSLSSMYKPAPHLHTTHVTYLLMRAAVPADVLK
jgi:hypothetical protein